MKDTFLYGNKVLITGASSGIGKAIAIALANAGYIVYGVSRSIEERKETIGKGSLISLRMDVTDEESIKGALSEIGDFSLLIHAAGFGIAGAAEDSDINLIRAQLETNYFGPMLLTKLAAPIMRRSKRSLVIAISSVAARVPLPYQSQYSSTKCALESYIEALRIEAKPFGLTASIIEPGDLSTGFTAKRKCAINESSPYYSCYKKALEVIEHDEKTGGSPYIIAKIVLRIVKRKNPPVRVTAGVKYKALTLLMRIFPDRLILFILSKMYKAN